MVQPSFFSQEGIAEIRQLGGATGAKLFDWLGHGYYAAKRFSPDHPYTLISEWLCADIASFINLPIPTRQIIPHNGEKWLGFEWRDNGQTFMAGMENKLVNIEAVCGMLLLDVLICNRDRHAGNVVLQHPSPDMDGYVLNVIDHSHALIGDLPDFQTFVNYVHFNPDPDTFLRIAPPQLRSIVQGMDNFDLWIKKVENIAESQIKNSATHIPIEWRPTPDDTNKLVDFLIERKSKIRGLIGAGISNFPACK